MKKKIFFYCNKEIYHYFCEYIESLESKLNIIKIIDNPSVIKKRFDKHKLNRLNNKYLFANWNYDFLDKIVNYDNIYIINFEQISRKEIYNKIESLSNRFKIINYSISNNKFKNSIHIPYQVNNLEIYNFEKIKNICFIGDLNSNHRKNILNNKRLINKIDIIGRYGKNRDQLLFKYKILLNLHYDNNYNVLEELRINRCIFNKMIVISENSIDQNKYILKNNMIFSSYDKIIDTVIDVLDNYDYYYKKLFSKFNLNKINKVLKNNIKYLKH